MKADALGRTNSEYSNGSTFSIFKEDGSGTVFYPSGSIAVDVTAGDGIPPGLYTTFFTNKKRNNFLGSWDCLGVGSCVFLSGRVRLCTTAQGGNLSNEEGDIVQSWNWDKQPLNEPIVLKLSENFTITLKDRSNICVAFQCLDRQRSFEVGKVLRRKDTYLEKVVGVGTGSERGKMILDVERCRQSLALTQRMREAHRAGKVDLTPPRKGAVDPRVMELVNNPTKVTTDSIRQQVFSSRGGQWILCIVKTEIEFIQSVTTHNAAALHALPYIEHEVGEDGRRRPAQTTEPDRASESFRLQERLTRGWTTRLPQDPLDAPPRRVAVLMGGRFETCTRFVSYLSKKVRLESVRASEYDKTLEDVPRNQAVLVGCISASVPLESANTLALLQDANGQMWERFGDMDPETKKFRKRAQDMPYRMLSFDMAESRLLTLRHNMRNVPMFLIYYGGKLVYMSNTFTQRYDKAVEGRHFAVDRMYEKVHKSAFGLTPEDVLQTLEQAAKDGAAGRFLPPDSRYGVPGSSTGSSAAAVALGLDAASLVAIRPVPSAAAANAQKRSILRRVISEPTAVDGIERRLTHVFGRSS